MSPTPIEKKILTEKHRYTELVAVGVTNTREDALWKG